MGYLIGGSLFGLPGMHFCCLLIFVLRFTFPLVVYLCFLFFLTSILIEDRFMNFERPKLPAEILKHSLEGKRKYFSYICLEVEVCIFLHETG